jgi:polyisoprenoid-binding protein YceI
MKRARVGIIGAAVFAVAAVAFAQAKPDFSGTWTLDPEASGMAAGGGQGRGGGRGGGALGNGPATVKQTADTLTIERTMGENKVTTTYKLDGTESKNSMTTGRGTFESTSTAKLDGSTLTITTKQDMGNGPMESTQKWTLAGSVLTVESTSARGTQKRVYKKTT